MADAPEIRRRVSLRSGASAPILFDGSGNPVRYEDLQAAGGEFSEAGRGIDPQLPIGSEPATMEVPFGVNYHVDARGGWYEKLTPFDLLKALSRVDYVRIVIEDIKGQILGMKGSPRPVEEAKDSDVAKRHATEAREFLRRPYRRGPWSMKWRPWAARAVEEMLVTDALTIAPKTTRGGDTLGMKLIDGATIRPRVGDLGDPPLPPAWAYHQVDKGRIRRGFTVEQLWYAPANPQTDNPYGLPPTECVLMIINLALRGLTDHLSYYVHGKVPKAIFALAQNFAPAQLREYQEHFNQLMSAAMSREMVKFLPAGQWIDSANRQWSYEWEELWMRAIAWAFQVSPIPIAKQMNRSTGETLEQSSLEAGPLRWASHLADQVTEFVQSPKGLAFDDCEFVFGEEEIEDGQVVYQRNVAYFGRGGFTYNEFLERTGSQPIEGPMGAERMIDTPSGPVLLSELVRKQEASESQKVSIDPSKIQRAFLEAPVLRRDELRAAVGATPIGGAEGDEFITIAQQPGPAALPEPTRQASVAGGSDGADPLAKVLGDWRRLVVRRLKDGRPLKKFDTRGGELPELTRRRIEWGLRRLPLMKTRTEQERRSRILHAQDVFELAKVGQSPEAEPPELDEPHQRIAAAVQAWLDAHRSELIDAALADLEASGAAAVEKAAGISKAVRADLHRNLDAANVDMTALVDDLEAAIQQSFAAGAAETAGAIGVDFSQAPEAALEFASRRAAELVGMQRQPDGSLIENSDKRWAINETLREDIRKKVERAIEEGWSPQQLKAELQPQFEPWRAEAIARTEPAIAHGEGAAAVYEDAEVDTVMVLDGPGCLPTGHDDEAAPPDASLIGVVQEDRLANGQIWTVAQYRARLLGHPNCVRGTVVNSFKRRVAA